MNTNALFVIAAELGELSWVQFMAPNNQRSTGAACVAALKRGHLPIVDYLLTTTRLDKYNAGDLCRQSITQDNTGLLRRILEEYPELDREVLLIFAMLETRPNCFHVLLDDKGLDSVSLALGIAQSEGITWAVPHLY